MEPLAAHARRGSPSGADLLYVMADLPHPPRGGNDLRYAQGLYILRALGWKLHVVAGAARADRAGADVGSDAVLTCSVPIPPPGVGTVERAQRLVDIAAGSRRRYPVNPSAVAHRRAGFDLQVLDAARALRPDAVVIRSLFAHLIPELRPYAGRIVLDLHDVDALQAQALLRHTTGLARAGIRLRLLAARRAERMLRTADELWVVSEIEAEYLQRRGIRRPTVLVRNAVAVGDAPRTDAERRSELLLVAGYGYPPNLAAARQLVEDVLPLVQRVAPQARATLVGRDLPAEFAARWSALPGVSVAGVVDDVSPYLRRAAALVFLPSWSTGTPLKVAEALASGLPLIANSVAVAGLAGMRDEDHFLRADSSVAAADQAIRLLADRALQRRLAAAGWQFARDALSHEAVLRAVDNHSVIGSSVVSR